MFDVKRFSYSDLVQQTEKGGGIKIDPVAQHIGALTVRGVLLHSSARSLGNNFGPLDGDELLELLKPARFEDHAQLTPSHELFVIDNGAHALGVAIVLHSEHWHMGAELEGAFGPIHELFPGVDWLHTLVVREGDEAESMALELIKAVFARAEQRRRQLVGVWFPQFKDVASSSEHVFGPELLGDSPFDFTTHDELRKLSVTSKDLGETMQRNEPLRVAVDVHLAPAQGLSILEVGDVLASARLVPNPLACGC